MTPKIVAVFVSDRGPLYLPGCFTSFNKHVDLNLIWRRWLTDDREHTLGMAGAVRDGWAAARDEGADYVMHVEEDFRFNGPVPLAEMVAILEAQPQLANLVLMRQPDPRTAEPAFGSVLRASGWPYEERSIGKGLNWLEHDGVFSLNPCLIPRRVFSLGWSDDNEAGFTQVCRDLGYRFAFYGQADDPPRVEHVGWERSSGWRL